MKGHLIEECVLQNKASFSAKGERIGTYPEIEVTIETEGPPIRQRPYRTPFRRREALNQKVQELLDEGIIRPSSSPWASPVVLVDKKDPSEGPRFCIDYTKLNQVTKKDAYPLPLIKDIFDQLQGKKIFSTLDLKSGYFQIPLTRRDKEKTAFICHKSLYEFNVLPMGLSNSPSIFQRTMEKVLKGLIGVICMVYLDDIVVFSDCEKTHVKNLQTVFDRLNQHGLTLNPKKCVFGLEELKLLGYIINGKGIRADPTKVEAIQQLAHPVDKKGVQSFLGMAGYYRQCIPNYAHVPEPLVALTRKDVPFHWGKEQEGAYQALKELLVSEKVMAHPQPDRKYILYTDACDYAVGAILCQNDDQGIERPVVYLSKQLSATQRRWATIEKEAYAVVYALKQLRPYLWGAEFETFTDHKPLTSLFTKEMNNTKIQRWSILLAEFGCKPRYYPGKLNIRSDMLSRIKPRAEVATFDTGDWVTDSDVSQLPPDEKLPIFHNLDLKQVSEAQQEMEEWTEAADVDSQYDIVNSLLYSTARPSKYAADYPRLVLPEFARKEIMNKAHEEVGHMAALKTMLKVQEVYVWQGMKEDIKNFVKNCPTCIVHSQKKVHLPMGEMPVANSPGQIIGVDLIGPFVKSPQGNIYILTVVDHCSGWAEAYPIPRKTNEEVWRRLRQDYFPRHDYPEILISDRGAEFNSKVFDDYLKAVGVKHHKTTPYHPQSNGKTERFNRTFKQIVNKLVNNRRDNWEEQLGVALTAYNKSTSSTTGHTPFFLHHGRHPRLPFSVANNPLTMLEGRLQILAEGLQQARELTLQSRQSNRERLAKKAQSNNIDVGDSVVIRAQEPMTLTSKWDPHWQVTQVRGKVVWLRHQQTGRQKILNRDKVQIVDPDIAWDDVRPRPIRNPNLSTRLTGITQHVPYQPRSNQQNRADNAMENSNPDMVGVQPVENHNQDCNQPMDISEEGQSAASIQPERSRVYLPRAAKRHIDRPSDSDQKRARIECLRCVVSFCK